MPRLFVNPWLYYKYSFIHTNFEGHLFITRTLLFGMHFHQLNHKIYNPETSRRAMSILWVSCEFFQKASGTFWRDDKMPCLLLPFKSEESGPAPNPERA